MTGLSYLMRNSTCSMCMPRAMLVLDKCYGILYRQAFSLCEERRCVCVVTLTLRGVGNKDGH